MATPKRSALGRGLDALISMDNIVTSGTSSIHEIELSQIVPNPDQPRREFDQEALEELASSIRELGIIQPISLRQVDGGNYQIIAGERRYRAAQMAGLETIPAYVRTVEDETLMEMALIENIQREDLNSIEIALAFQKLIELYQLTQEKLSERVGKKRTTIANYLRLLKLPAVCRYLFCRHRRPGNKNRNVFFRFLNNRYFLIRSSLRILRYFRFRHLVILNRNRCGINLLHTLIFTDGSLDENISAGINLAFRFCLNASHIFKSGDNGFRRFIFFYFINRSFRQKRFHFTPGRLFRNHWLLNLIFCLNLFENQRSTLLCSTASLSFLGST